MQEGEGSTWLQAGINLDDTTNRYIVGSIFYNSQPKRIQRCKQVKAGGAFNESTESEDKQWEN